MSVDRSNSPTWSVDAPCAHPRPHHKAHGEWSISTPVDQHGLSAEEAYVGIGLEAAEMGIARPEHDGGQGGTLMDAVIAIEQVAAVCPRSADVVQFGNFGPIRVFAEYGTEAQKKRWLGELLAGRMVMLANQIPLIPAETDPA